jgi:hypothetical protein
MIARVIFTRSYDQFEVGDTGEIVAFINGTSFITAVIVLDKNSSFVTSSLLNFKRI